MQTCPEFHCGSPTRIHSLKHLRSRICGGRWFELDLAPWKSAFSWGKCCELHRRSNSHRLKLLRGRLLLRGMSETGSCCRGSAFARGSRASTFRQRKFGCKFYQFLYLVLISDLSPNTRTSPLNVTLGI